jgi:hypothetical protein
MGRPCSRIALTSSSSRSSRPIIRGLGGSGDGTTTGSGAGDFAETEGSGGGIGGSEGGAANALLRAPISFARTTISFTASAMCR